MNEFDRIIENYSELEISEIIPILKKYNDEGSINRLNSVDMHKLIDCRAIYLAIALRYNAIENYFFHNNRFIIGQIERIIKEKEGLEHKDLSDSFYKKGLILMWLDKQRDSMACFTTALKFIDAYKIHSQTKIIPNHDKKELNCHLYFERGNIFLHLGEYNLAIKDHNKIIRIKPDYTRVYKSLGISYTFIGLFDKAKECFDKYIPERDVSVRPINIDKVCYSVNNVPKFVIESMRKVNYWLSDSVFFEHEIDNNGGLSFGTLMIK